MSVIRKAKARLAAWRRANGWSTDPCTPIGFYKNRPWMAVNLRDELGRYEGFRFIVSRDLG